MSPDSAPDRGADELPTRRVRARRLRARTRRRLALAVVVVAGVVVAGVVAVRLVDGAVPSAADAPPAPAAVSLPIPAQTRATATPAPATGCDDPGVRTALAARDDATVVAAFGGGRGFRDAVVTGAAPCVDLGDADHVWVVVDKRRPFAPIDWAPGSVARPDRVRNLAGGGLLPAAATAMTDLVAAADLAGSGEIALASAYRSYATQRQSYASQAGAEGAASAEQSVARPGFSEHQSGLAADVVACGARGCGTLDDLAGTPQGSWVAEHAWEHGWIVRYEPGRTAITGYESEPWHLRYLGPELARAYHEGGWRTLEEFFGLPAAPDY